MQRCESSLPMGANAPRSRGVPVDGIHAGCNCATAHAEGGSHMTARSHWLAVFTAASMTAASVAQNQAVPVGPSGPVGTMGPPPVTEGAPVVLESGSPSLLTVEAGVTFLRRSRPHRKGVIGE